MAFLPANLASQLNIAGQSQVDTGKKLKSSATRVRAANNSLNADEQILQTITALQVGATSIRPILATIATALTFIAGALRGIRIPTISTTTATVVGIRVVTGLTLGNVSPFNTTATRFDTMSASVTSIRASLLTIAASLASLRTAMPVIQSNISNSADDMDDAGDDLIASGNAMRAAAAL